MKKFILCVITCSLIGFANNGYAEELLAPPPIATEQEKLLIRLKEYMDNEGYLYETPYLSKANTESVIVALEKQIPEQANFSGDDWDECPECYSVIEKLVAYNNGKKVISNPNYCVYCGQRLDWSVEE